MHFRCLSIREEKRKKEVEEEEARRRAAEEERMRREEEEEARRKAEEEQRRRMEEAARRRAEEAARKAKEQRLAEEPQTREDSDIELVTEEMLDKNLNAQGLEEEEEGEDVNRSSNSEEERGKEKELEREAMHSEACSNQAEAGPQLDEEEEDLESQTLEESKADLPSDRLISSALTPTSPAEGEDKEASTTSTPPNAEQKRPQSSTVNRGLSTRSQEKREQRRQRGLEHSRRESERVASSSSTNKDPTTTPKSKNQEPSKLKERSDSKELDQYTFVNWKVKEDKGAKKEAKSSPPSAGPVRPSSLPLAPADSLSERNGLSENVGAVNLQRRPGAIKEKPEKWRGRRSNGELSENISPSPPQSREQTKKLYVSFCWLKLLYNSWFSSAFL